MQREHIFLVPALSLLGLAHAAAADVNGHTLPQSTPPLAVSIVVPDSRSGSEDYIGLNDQSSHFDVVIQNVSDQPLYLWSPNCSWGENNNVFLRILAVNGKPLAKPLGISWGFSQWNANSPTPRLLPPHGLIVQEIRLYVEETAPDAQVKGPSRYFSMPSSYYYVGFPPPKKGERETVKMQAVLAISSDALTRQYSVWTGESDSELKDYTIENDMPTK